MNKKYFSKEIKDYFSILAFFVILSISLNSNIVFATTCAELYDGGVRDTLDHCKTFEVSPSDITSSVDNDGNQPAQCDDVSLTYNPYKSPDYFYDKNNKYCLIWGTGISITYATASAIANTACFKFLEYDQSSTGIDPTSYAKQLKIAAGLGTKIKSLKGVLALLKSAAGNLTSIASSSTTSIFTDPIITLQIEYAIDAVRLGYYITYNALQCSTWTSEATACMAVGGYVTGGVCAMAVANAITACTMTTTCAVSLATLTALSQSLIWSTTAGFYNEASAQINRAQLCGIDWESKVYTEFDRENFATQELYPQTGSYSNSYSYKLEKCFKYGTTQALSDYGVDCSEIINNDGYCELDDSLCTGISMQSKSIKNRLYRERLYKGKEYKISIDYTSEKCTDPRPTNQKGFKGIEQRYYFRGTDSAQYACNRFTYKNQGCILADGTEISSTEAASSTSKATSCKQAFENAYNCCRSRAALGVCVYDIEDDDGGRDSNKNTMCIKSSGDYCTLNVTTTLAPTPPKFLAFESEEDAMKICIKNANYCPYAYNVGGGTSIEDQYCNGDYSCTGAKPASKIDSDDRYVIPSEEDKATIWSSSKSKTPTNAYGETKNYCTYNIHCTEIGSTGDSEFTDIDNKFLPKVCSDFVGDSQNLPVVTSTINLNVYNFIKKAFKSYNVNIENSSDEIEEDLNDLSNSEIRSLLKDMEEVTLISDAIEENGYSKTTLENIISSINKTAASGVEFDLHEYRGFTAPIVQCLKETLYNMFNNKAGQSYCADSTEEVNAEGLCGTDTFGPPESIDTDKYIYIIGEDLPEDSNIFYKIQNRLQFIIKMAAVFAIIVMALNFLLKGELDIFNDVKKPKQMIVGLIKFSIVFYFAVGTAWQTKFYEWIDDSTAYLYYKFFDLSLLDYKGYSNIDTEITCTKTVKTTTCSTQNLFMKATKFTASGTYEIRTNTDGLIIEVWGASGGSNGGTTINKGGYSYGTLEIPSTALNLNVGDTLYVNIGSSGGTSQKGGGATDVSLSDTGNFTCNYDDTRIIVAGGGGGNGTGGTFVDKLYVGGDGGGGYGRGGNGSSYDTGAFGYGATFILPGEGGTHSDYSGEDGECAYGGEGKGEISATIYGNGGDGWFGGGGASGGYAGGSGGGGSGFINSNFIDFGGSNGANSGEGYAKITPYKSSEECYTYSDITEDYVVDDVSEFPSNVMPTSEDCSTTDNVETCYSDCTESEKEDIYGNKEYVWKDNYDGCYFGDSYYPNGKRYLSIFDSLDCKLMNYFNYGPDIDLPGILHMLLLSLIWSPLALIVICLGFIFFFILLTIVMKVFYIFLMSLFAINILIYTSPLIFPSLLFKKYKGMFETWLDSLIGYSLQFIFIIIFAGFFIGNMEKLGLGDAKYINHDPATGRLPTLDCSDSDLSLLCIFKVDTTKGELPLLGTKVYKYLGLGPLVSISSSLNNDFVGTVVILLKTCLILYVLLEFLKKLPNLAIDLTGGSKFEGGNIGITESIKEVSNKAQITSRVAKYSGIAGGKGAVNTASNIVKKGRKLFKL